MICHDRRFIFVHIRRTGGTSVEAALVDGANALEKTYLPRKNTQPVPMRMNGKGYKHRRLKNYDRQYIDDYFTFSIVRNPWERAVSRYFWEKKQRRACAAAFDNFRDYVLVRKGLPAGQWNVSGDNAHKYLTQFACLQMEGQIGVDSVWRFERLAEDYAAHAERLGLTGVPLPHVFESEHGPYWNYYDDETAAIVADAYDDDIRIFGYAFGR